MIAKGAPSRTRLLHFYEVLWIHVNGAICMTTVSMKRPKLQEIIPLKLLLPIDLNHLIHTRGLLDRKDSKTSKLVADVFFVCICAT